MFKKIKVWIREGNDCSRCPACWEDIMDNENGREYDCGCFINGSKFDEKPCRIPFLLRFILCRRRKYLNNHHYDGIYEWYQKGEEGENIIETALTKEMDGFICWKDGDGTLHEYNQEMKIGDITWRVKSEYDDFLIEPRKSLWQKWKLLIAETVSVPVDYIKSFILE